MGSEDISPETKWPSVDLAYAFVLPSYQMMSSRFEAADGRLSALLTFAASVNLGAPVFAKAVGGTDVSFKAPWFIGAVSLFAVVVVVGLWGRVKGRITLPNPMVHYTKNLKDSRWEFQKNAIYFAGKHFEQNERAVAFKGNTAIALTSILIVEMAMLIAWIAGTPSPSLFS